MRKCASSFPTWKHSGILSLARDFQVPGLYVHPGRFRTRIEPEIEADIVRLLFEADVELVVLAGFMRIVKEPLLSAFPRKIINIHPSLLPKFPGLEAWKQALAAGEKVTGCTVHYVDAAVDAGEILGQEIVPILPGDTPESLHGESNWRNTCCCRRSSRKSRKISRPEEV